MRHDGHVPELPEVEALVAFLGERTVGRAVTGVEIGAISALKTFAPPPSALVGQRVAHVVRHGKWLDVETVPGALHLVIHLAHSGWLRWHDVVPASALRPGHSPVALRVRLDDGSGFDVTEAGSYKRLALHVVNAPSEIRAVATLGVDPLSAEFTVDRLTELLGTRRQQVKGLLRDQSMIAGIGNAYSDEILHAARVSPFTPTTSFDTIRASELHRTIVTVLQEAVDAAQGRPADELKDAKRRRMRVHGRTGQPCPGWDGVPCGDTVHEVAFADSSLQYCPTCQTGRRTLADRRMSRLLR